MNNKITLKHISENTVSLQRNGEDMVCPMYPPITFRQRVNHPVLGIQEQIQVQKTPCNSGCPLFDIHQSGSEIRITINCGATSLCYDVKEVIPLERKNQEGSSLTDSHEQGRSLSII